MSAYTDYIDSLNPTLCMHFDGVTTQTGSTTVTTPTPAHTNWGAGITKGTPMCAEFTGTEACDYGDSDDINVGGPWYTRTYSLWATYEDPTIDSLIYNEGANVRNTSLYFGIGGVPVYVMDNDADTNPGCPWSEAIFGPVCRKDIPYHLGMTWHGNGVDYSYLKAYLNGVLIQEKPIYKFGTTEVGGRYNAHSGNIEIGLGQTIIVSQQTFDVSYHKGRVANVAVWDGVDLGDSVMYQLFAQGADTVTSQITFTNIPPGTDIRMFEMNSGVVGNQIDFDLNNSTGSAVLDYQVDVAKDVRICVAHIDYTLKQFDVSLPREGTTYDVGLLLKQDRWYKNP